MKSTSMHVELTCLKSVSSTRKRNSVSSNSLKRTHGPTDGREPNCSPRTFPFQKKHQNFHNSHLWRKHHKMKINCKQQDLAKGISTVNHAVSSRSTLPILANILLSTDNGRLKLSSTNLEIGI